jgi:thymidine phosphorylase
LTDMNEPLASAAGNAVEVVNAVEFLTGKHRDPRLENVTVALAAEMLVSSGIAKSPRAGAEKAADALSSGKAAEMFGRMVSLLGGPADFVEKYEKHLPRAEVEHVVPATKAGYVSAIRTREIGLAVVTLGGGRTDPAASIDHAVGITRLLPVGAKVKNGEPLALVHARSEGNAEEAAAVVARAFAIAAEKPAAKNPVLRRVEAG